MARSVSETVETVETSGAPDDLQVEADRPAAAGAGAGEVVEAAVGPLTPSAEVRAELRAWLEADEGRIGEVHRFLGRGLAAADVARELEVSPGFVANHARTITALTDGMLPVVPTVAQHAASRFRAILKKGQVSRATRDYLEVNLAELEKRANDDDARVAEVERAKGRTDDAEARNEPGIYVYALPHYIRHPYEPGTGHTLLKVGRSDSDVIQRFRQETRTAALPEEPILLRIYRTESGATAKTEAQFHRLLTAADHDRSVARTAGREWFTTSTRFLDEIARILSLPAEVVNDTGDHSD